MIQLSILPLKEPKVSKQGNEKEEKSNSPFLSYLQEKQNSSEKNTNAEVTNGTVPALFIPLTSLGKQPKETISDTVNSQAVKTKGKSNALTAKDAVNDKEAGRNDLDLLFIQQANNTISLIKDKQQILTNNETVKPSTNTEQDGSSEASMMGNVLGEQNQVLQTVALNVEDSKQHDPNNQKKQNDILTSEATSSVFNVASLPNTPLQNGTNKENETLPIQILVEDITKNNGLPKELSSAVVPPNAALSLIQEKEAVSNEKQQTLGQKNADYFPTITNSFDSGSVSLDQNVQRSKQDNTLVISGDGKDTSPSLSFLPSTDATKKMNAIIGQSELHRTEVNSQGIQNMQPDWNNSSVNQMLNVPTVNRYEPSSSATINPTISNTVSNLAQDVTSTFLPRIHVSGTPDKMEATFSLTPQQLGTVDVKVSIQDGHVTAHFIADSSLGKNMLELQVDSLYTALQQQGLQVEKIHITQEQSATFSSMFSQGGDSTPKQGQQQSKRRSENYSTKEEYSDTPYELEWVSQINTMA